MTHGQRILALTERLKECLGREEDILFAYVYGSSVIEPEISGADIDVAVYLKALETEGYLRREEELTALLVSRLHTDEIDLRILNVLPLVFQYSVLKEGSLLFSRDEQQRVDFETGVMARIFELKPYLDEYKEMLSLRIRGGK